jgi:hypothetical protein
MREGEQQPLTVPGLLLFTQNDESLHLARRTILGGEPDSYRQHSTSLHQ